MTRFASALLLVLFVTLAGCGPSESSGDEEGAKSPAETTAPGPGATLYHEHCAGCHGPKGDGDGTTELPVPRGVSPTGASHSATPATRCSRRSVSACPARTPCRDSARSSREAERWQVIDHLLTLMPASDTAEAKDRVMVVRDRPLIARGTLPPVAEGSAAPPPGSAHRAARRPDLRVPHGRRAPPRGPSGAVRRPPGLERSRRQPARAPR